MNDPSTCVSCTFLLFLLSMLLLLLTSEEIGIWRQMCVCVYRLHITHTHTYIQRNSEIFEAGILTFCIVCMNGHMLGATWYIHNENIIKTHTHTIRVGHWKFIFISFHFGFCCQKKKTEKKPNLVSSCFISFCSGLTNHIHIM